MTLKPGSTVFNLYSLRVGEIFKIVRTSRRSRRFAVDTAVVLMTEPGNRFRRVRWRLDNCQLYTPQALLARRAFVLLNRLLKVPSWRLKMPRRYLGAFGFSRVRRGEFARLVRRECRRRLSARQLKGTMTCTQAITAVLASPKM